MADAGPVLTEAAKGPTTEAAGEARSRFLWSGVIVGLLGVQVLMCLIAAVLATGSPSLAVVPDYHQKALDWDQHLKEKRQSDQLGWSTGIAALPTGEGSPIRTLQVVVTDRSGAAVSGAAVSVTLFPIADAGATQEVALLEAERNSGVYRQAVVVHRPGVWEVRIRVTRGESRYLASEEVRL